MFLFRRITLVRRGRGGEGGGREWWKWKRKRKKQRRKKNWKGERRKKAGVNQIRLRTTKQKTLLGASKQLLNT